MKELEKLLEERNLAWEIASKTNDIEDWNYFKNIATNFIDLLRKEKQKVWEDFSKTLNHSTQPSKVMKILKSTNRELLEALPNSIIKSNTGKKITNDKGRNI